jgi:hypothetical protein
VPDVSKGLLSVSAALKVLLECSPGFLSVILAHHSHVATSNRPVAATLM